MAFIPSTSELIDATKLLTEGQIMQGMKVADLGCGTTGHFVFPAAEMVGKEGLVYAVDIQKGALEAIESRKRLEGIDNVEGVWSDIERYKATRIADGTVDLVLLVNNLFLAHEKNDLAREIMRLMAPGGRLVIADWKVTQAPFGPPAKDRIPPDEAKKIFTNAGFTLVSEFEAGKYHYGLVFQKNE